MILGTVPMDLALSAVLGLAFGALAAACAFVISYSEYKRNWSFRGNAAAMALRSAAVAFAFFFFAAVLLAIAFQTFAH
jgi:hypothetical protein